SVGAAESLSRGRQRCGDGLVCVSERWVVGTVGLPGGTCCRHPHSEDMHVGGPVLVARPLVCLSGHVPPLFPGLDLRHCDNAPPPARSPSGRCHKQLACSPSTSGAWYTLTTESRGWSCLPRGSRTLPGPHRPIATSG